MTTEEDKIRRAVAEIMHGKVNSQGVTEWPRVYMGGLGWQNSPDYVNDRNAIASALATLTESEQDSFALALSVELEGYDEDWIRDIWTIATAPPLALAKAFLKAKNVTI